MEGQLWNPARSPEHKAPCLVSPTKGGLQGEFRVAVTSVGGEAAWLFLAVCYRKKRSFGRPGLLTAPTDRVQTTGSPAAKSGWKFFPPEVVGNVGNVGCILGTPLLEFLGTLARVVVRSSGGLSTHEACSRPPRTPQAGACGLLTSLSTAGMLDSLTLWPQGGRELLKRSSRPNLAKVLEDSRTSHN